MIEHIIKDAGGVEWRVTAGWLEYRGVFTQHKWQTMIGSDPCGIAIDLGRAEIIAKLFGLHP